MAKGGEKVNKREAKKAAYEYAWQLIDAAIGSGSAYDREATDEDNAKFIAALEEIQRSLEDRAARFVLPMPAAMKGE